MIGLPACVSL
jgi:hypothetical protein